MSNDLGNTNRSSPATANRYRTLRIILVYRPNRFFVVNIVLVGFGKSLAYGCFGKSVSDNSYITHILIFQFLSRTLKKGSENSIFPVNCRGNINIKAYI